MSVSEAITAVTETADVSTREEHIDANVEMALLVMELTTVYLSVCGKQII